MINRLVTQVQCRISMEGRATISTYDHFSPACRELLRNSKINVCPACIAEIAGYDNIVSVAQAICNFECEELGRPDHVSL